MRTDFFFMQDERNGRTKRGRLKKGPMYQWAIALEEGRRTAQKLLRICEEHGWICWLCFQKIHDPRKDFDKLTNATWPTLDHVKPKALGGTRAIHNLRPAHAKCNAARGCAGLDRK